MVQLSEFFEQVLLAFDSKAAPLEAICIELPEVDHERAISEIINKAEDIVF